MCHEAGQSAFLHIQLYLSTNLDHILFATFLDTNSLSVLMCRKAVNQSINQSKHIAVPMCGIESSGVSLHSGRTTGTAPLLLF